MLEYVPDQGLSVPRQTHVFALLNAAMADAGVASWDAKFAYRGPRPENAVRDLGLDPDCRLTVQRGEQDGAQS